MVAQSSSRKQTLWQKIILWAGLLVLLAACQPQEAPTTCPQIECPEVTCPAPERYEDLWVSSAHADSTSEAFTHWDAATPAEIPVDCAKCHSKTGFMDFLGIDETTADKVDKPAPIGSTITCFVCHNEATDQLTSVVFSSGVRMRELGPEARCIQCHQGRASTATVEQAIAEAGMPAADSVSAELTFITSHWTSAATPFGSEVHGAYEYTGKSYQGRYLRGDEFFTCMDCHDQHSLALKFETCMDCHTIIGAKAQDIRVNTTDYDGDGNIHEGIAYEITALHEALYAAIQNYASAVAGTPIVFDLATYPYFFIDSNYNGNPDVDELVRDNQYDAWTPTLLRAAYNYNYIAHDPGAFAHNSTYSLQILFDSLADIGGDTNNMIRP